jgi:hypothetical protein
MTAKGTLQPGQSVKFEDEIASLTKEASQRLDNAPISEDNRYGYIFGQDTIKSLKEKQKKDKAAKKKLPKNFKPESH